jgi:methyl-accepting chemotaxis protein
VHQKRYRPIPDSSSEVEELQEAVDAIKETVEVMARIRGYTDDSFVTLGELVQVIANIDGKLNTINARLDALEAP